MIAFIAAAILVEAVTLLFALALCRAAAADAAATDNTDRLAQQLTREGAELLEWERRYA